MGKFHTLALNFVGWSFGITVTRHFRPKLGHSNEMIYFDPVNRGLKLLPNKGLGSFQWPMTCKMPQSPKSTKKYSWKYNDYISVINNDHNFGHVKKKFFILYTIYYLQTRIASLPSQSKLLKEILKTLKCNIV